MDPLIKLAIVHYKSEAIHLREYERAGILRGKKVGREVLYLNVSLDKLLCKQAVQRGGPPAAGCCPWKRGPGSDVAAPCYFVLPEAYSLHTPFWRSMASPA